MVLSNENRGESKLVLIDPSIIYLSRVLCLSVCDCVCVCVTICVGTLCYSFSFSNQTDQRGEMDGLEMEILEMGR